MLVRVRTNGAHGGASVGVLVGAPVGSMVVSDVGALDGVDEAMAEGALVGVVVGAPVGSMVVSDVGALDGADEAMAEGALVSVVVGAPVGEGHDVRSGASNKRAELKPSLRDAPVAPKSGELQPWIWILPPCQPSPNVSFRCRVWVPGVRQTSCVMAVLSA